MEQLNNERELTREERLEIEEKAIQALVNMGVKFNVPLKINPVKPPRFIRWWNKHFPNHVKMWRDKRIPKGWDVSETEVPNAALQTMERVYMRHFHLKPLYLGTMDCLRRLYLNIEYDEEKIQAEPIQESKRLFKYIPLMAEIAAVAVLNNPVVADKEYRLLEYFMTHQGVALSRITRLEKLADVISQMMNPGGFTSSIRSIREIGTTNPKKLKANRVE